MGHPRQKLTKEQKKESFCESIQLQTLFDKPKKFSIVQCFDNGVQRDSYQKVEQKIMQDE